MTETLVYTLPTDADRLVFMESLASDLQMLGHDIKLENTNNQTTFKCKPNPLFFSDKLSAADSNTLRDYYLALRNRQLQESGTRDLIMRMEEDGVLDLLIDGSELQPKQIQPEIRICRSRRERDIFRYFRNAQSVPTSEGVGRRFWALVYDVGQKQEALIGIIALTSPIYSLGDRDRYLGWTGIDSRKKERETRRRGLARIMQLSVCMAVPPYNSLCGGKLMAALSLSNPIQEEFASRYTDDNDQPEQLLAVTTTSAFGNHAAIFNRIHLRQIQATTDYQKTRKNGKSYPFLFEHIGNTSRYSTVMISQNTSDLAGALVEGMNISDLEDEDAIRSSSSGARALDKALRMCGLNRSILVANRKGVHIAYLCDDNIEHLRPDSAPENAPKLNLPLADVAEYWLNRWVMEWVIGSRQDLLEEAQNFQKVDYRLSQYLESD